MKVSLAEILLFLTLLVTTLLVPFVCTRLFPFEVYFLVIMFLFWSFIIAAAREL